MVPYGSLNPPAQKRSNNPKLFGEKKLSLVHLKDPSFSLTALEISVNRTVLDAGPTRPGKRLHKTMGKPWKTMGISPFSKGKSTISMTIFNSYD
jgi:hypothetical protein